MALKNRAATLSALLAAAFAGGVAAAPAVQAERSAGEGTIVLFKADFTGAAPVAQIYSMDSGGGDQTNLSAAGGGAGQVDIQPSLSPDRKKIAFVRLDPATFSAQVWTMSVDGSQQTDISNDGATASESAPSWTEDGLGILFVKQVPGSFPGAGGSIWARASDGTGSPRQLTSGPADANPAMSPDGDLIAFSRPNNDGTRHLIVIKADGGSAPRDLGMGSKPDWSPDSERLVYGQAGTGPIMVVNVSDPSDRQTLTAPFTGVPPFNEAPVWSPNGKQIAFMRCMGFGACQIAVMAASGADQHVITSDANLSDQHPDW